MASRWKVTYTKRDAKKKKYLDGFLLVRPNKMILLDSNDKPVDEKFIGKNVAVEAGSEITFNYYLVDVDTLEVKKNNIQDAPAHCPKRRKVSSFPARPAGSELQEGDDVRAATTSAVTSSIKPRYNSPRSFQVARNIPVQFRFSVPSGPPQRNVVVPDKFKELREYKTIMSEALVEEISFIISAFASRFKAAQEKIPVLVAGDITEAQLEKHYTSCDINLLSRCELVKRCSKPGYVTIRLGRATEPLSYSKGDLMIMSSSINFPEHSSSEYTVVATAEAYGSSRNSFVELRLHGEPVRDNEVRVYVLQGPSIRSELAMLDCVRKIELSSTPLLPLLLGSETYVPRNVSLGSEMAFAAKAAARKYKLNNDQETVLLTVAKWFSGDRNEDPHVCLVHGPFGSGKSHLLVVLIIFLSEVLKDSKPSRFIVACQTNSAVDRVLTGLLELGFNDFLRVGSLSKIASNILPYSIHAASKGSGKDDAEEDLKQLLKETYGNERLKIENELKALRDGRMLFRKKKLQKVRVVGVTCSSAINEVLQGNTFQVCLLDECSQILEPQSLLPISQFRCQRLIAVGDPEQLPPVLCQAERNCGMNSQNLSRTLFVRLAALGHKPVLLRTQYRCHPRLARVPNRLFYGGELLDGCSEVDRSPLLSGLEPLVFCDTGREGKESKTADGSYTNSYEAEKVGDLVETLLQRGVSGNRIGVIALYKAQVTLIRRMLFPENCETGRKPKETVKSEVTVSTVDAFQGMEKDIIIISCCRTTGLGFLTSRNRLNVALTRAKHHLLIIGKASNLQRSPMWEELLENVKRSTSCFKNVEDIQMDIGAARYISNKSHLLEENEPSDHESEGTSQTLLGQIPSTENLNFLFQTAEEVWMNEVLDAVHFGPGDFWEGYKLYCIGHYSHSFEHQDQFLKTLMADVLRQFYKEDEFRWGKKFDDRVRSSWSMMEDYVKQRHGVNCSDIRLLIQKYDDINQLAASEHGVYFLDLCKVQDESSPVLRPLKKKTTDGSIVDNILNHLGDMDRRLERLRRNSNG